MAELFPAYAPIPSIVARNAAAAIAAIQERPALALLPVHTDWNDFSYHFGATLLVMTSAKDATSIDIRLMFEGKRRTEDAITELLGQRAWAPLAEANLPYCSVLDSLDLYREIVRLLGFERAVTAVVQQALPDVLPDGAFAIEPDGVDLLYLDGPAAAPAADPQKMLWNFGQPQCGH